MDRSRFGFSELRERPQKLPARVAIAFVDACQSGRLTRTKGGRASRWSMRFEDNRSCSVAFDDSQPMRDDGGR